MGDIKTKIEKFNNWIRKNTLFAVAVPIVLLLLAFFISTTISSMTGKSNPVLNSTGYNNELPNQTTGLEVQNPMDIYNKTQLDSINAAKNEMTLNSIDVKQEQNDSLQKVLNELDAFSFSEDKIVTEDTSKIAKEKPTSRKSEIEERLAYRKILLDARRERQLKSQDYSAPYVETEKETEINTFIKAAIYRDQFVLPSERVNLILREDTFLNGRMYPKNTFLFATCNIQGSRLLLNVSNIENSRADLKAYDYEDRMLGLYNERVGELLMEFKTDIEKEGIDLITNEISEISDAPLSGNLPKLFGNYFRKRRYKQKDKILLIDGTPLYLTVN